MFLTNKKTYLLSGILALWGVIGFIMGELPPEEAARLVFEGGLFAALRAGVQKIQKP